MVGNSVVFLGWVVAEFYNELIQVFDIHFTKISFIHNAIFYQTVACFLIIYGIETSDILKKIFSLKVFDKISSISFGIYLIHWPLICSFSALFYNILYTRVSHNVACTYVFAVTTIILFILAFGFLQLEKRFSKLTNKLTNNIV